MNDWIHTRRGVRLVEGTLPKIATALAGLREEFKRYNDARETEAEEPVIPDGAKAGAYASPEDSTYAIADGPDGARGVVITTLTDEGISVAIVYPGGGREDYQVVGEASVHWSSLMPGS